MMLFTLLLSKLLRFTPSENFTSNKAHKIDTYALARMEDYKMQTVICNE